MVGYLFGSIFLAIIGLAAVIGFLAVALPRARRRRELEHRKSELASQQELEDYLRRLDQAKTAEDIDRLGDHNERKDQG